MKYKYKLTFANKLNICKPESVNHVNDPSQYLYVIIHEIQNKISNNSRIKYRVPDEIPKYHEILSFLLLKCAVFPPRLVGNFDITDTTLRELSLGDDGDDGDEGDFESSDDDDVV